MVDFLSEIKNIQDQGTPYTSKLFEFLKPEIQFDIRQHDGNITKQVELLQEAYMFNYAGQFMDLAQTDLRPEKIRKQFAQMILRSKMIEQSLEEKKVGDFEQCTVGKGIYNIMILTMFLIANRYHEIFNLPQFLWCFLQCKDFTTQNVDALGNQLILSRLNFILNNTYLPVVATYSGDNHATSTLYVPIVSEHDHRVDWFVIYINTNGSESFKHRRIDDHQRAIHQLQDFLKPQVNESFDVLDFKCDKNIQQMFSTCVSWSFYLTLFMLVNSQQFYQRSRHDGDFVHRFCQHLSMRNQNSKTIDQFHEFVDDLYASFHFLTVDTLRKTPSFNLQHYISTIQTGNPNPKMLLLCERIFEATEGAMNHLTMHLNKMPLKIDSLKRKIQQMELSIKHSRDEQKKMELLNLKDKLRQLENPPADGDTITTDEETEEDRVSRQQRKISHFYDLNRRSARIRRTPIHTLSPTMIHKKRAQDVISTTPRQRKTPRQMKTPRQRKTSMRRKTPMRMKTPRQRKTPMQTPNSRKRRATPRIGR